MPKNDIENVQDFLAYCDSIDLTEFEGAAFLVGSEVVHVVEA